MRNDFESNYLMHHGIKGMKWGVRRYQNEDGTLTDAGKKRYARVVSNGNIYLLEKSNRKGKGNGTYDIVKGDKKIGTTLVDDDDSWGGNKDTSHIDWIGIKEKERRKGYGKETLDLLIQDAIDKGKKYVTLEAAGLDPAAIHIYEKAGFEAYKNMDSDIWDGLTFMKKDLRKG